MCLQRRLQSYMRGQANLVHIFIPMGGRDSISSTGRGQARGPMVHVRWLTELHLTAGQQVLDSIWFFLGWWRFRKSALFWQGLGDNMRLLL